MNGKNFNVEKLNNLLLLWFLFFSNTLFLSSLLQFGLPEIPVVLTNLAVLGR